GRWMGVPMAYSPARGAGSKTGRVVPRKAPALLGMAAAPTARRPAKGRRYCRPSGSARVPRIGRSRAPGSRCGDDTEVWGRAGQAAPPSPVRRRVVLQELAPHVVAGIDAVDDRVDDARRAVDDVQRRVEALLDD